MRSLTNRKAIEDELAIVNHPLTAEERPAIVELVGLLHAATGVEEYFELHLKLLVQRGLNRSSQQCVPGMNVRNGCVGPHRGDSLG